MRTLICTPPVGSQARQSVTSIDGLTAVVSTQSKFALSVVASCFGSCHPLVVVAAVEIFTVSQLVMACKRTYSNILTVSLVVALSPVVHCTDGHTMRALRAHIVAQYGPSWRTCVRLCEWSIRVVRSASVQRRACRSTAVFWYLPGRFKLWIARFAIGKRLHDILWFGAHELRAHPGRYGDSTRHHIPATHIRMHCDSRLIIS